MLSLVGVSAPYGLATLGALGTSSTELLQSAVPTAEVTVENRVRNAIVRFCETVLLTERIHCVAIAPPAPA